jgi:hypothetical protein
MQVVRARVSRTGKLSGFANLTFRAVGAMQNTLGVGGCGSEIFASATCSLLFSKASAATLPQQEKNDSAYVQRCRVNIFGFVGTVARKPSRRFTFDVFESSAVALRRALYH